MSEQQERWKTTVVLKEVAAEREKQRRKWGNEHDDEHTNGEIATAGAAYALYPRHAGHAGAIWPWGEEAWSVEAARRDDLVKAAALLVAEIERIDRAEGSEA